MSSQTLAHPNQSVWGKDSVLKRELHRHSVERDVKSFVGWQKLSEIVNVAESIGVNGERNAGFVAALFCTGGRVSETLALKPSMITIVKGCVPKLVLVTGMPLSKRYKKLGDFLDDRGHKRYKTEKINATRDFSFRVDEPLVKPMIHWVIHALENRCEWLFPSPYTDKPLTRKWAYQLIGKVGVKAKVEIWPHWFRSQRACCLSSEYELKESTLLEWFQWESWLTAKQYSKRGPLGMAKQMGVQFRKDRGLKSADLEDLKAE